MNTQHANCTHPKRLVRRFGERRRQCGDCKSTWRIRRKKRGRKPKRASPAFVSAYLSGAVSTIRTVALKRNIGRSSVQRSLSKSLERYVRVHDKSWLALVPKRGNLLLIADAIWYRVKGMKYTIYVLLLRPRVGTEAVILPPTLFSGHEDIEGWNHALGSVPEKIRTRIEAIVCDGCTALVHCARERKWLLQRCQFHLLSAIQNYVTTGPRSKNPLFAQKVMRLVQQAITEPEMSLVYAALGELGYIRERSRSKGLRRVLGGLSMYINEYRTYIFRPEWHLPATSNTAESCIQCVRDLMYQCRGFRTKEKLELWLKAFSIHQKTIRCRGRNQPN